MVRLISLNKGKSLRKKKSSNLLKSTLKNYGLLGGADEVVSPPEGGPSSDDDAQKVEVDNASPSEVTTSQEGGPATDPEKVELVREIAPGEPAL